jgi:hypothetical protein
MNNFITLCARAKLLDLIAKYRSKNDKEVTCVLLTREHDSTIAIAMSNNENYGPYTILISSSPKVFTNQKTFEHLTERCIDYEYDDACFCIARSNKE